MHAYMLVQVLVPTEVPISSCTLTPIQVHFADMNCITACSNQRQRVQPSCHRKPQKAIHECIVKLDLADLKDIPP